MNARWFALAVASLLLVGFAQPGEGEGEVPMDPSQPAPVIDPALQPQIDHAQQDLATRLGIAPTDIEVLEAYTVTWPDGSLGCPMPDMAYIQVLMDGALIRLRAFDAVYEYHSGATRPPFLCEQPTPPADGGPPPA
jgi:hypothetical protein